MAQRTVEFEDFIGDRQTASNDHEAVERTPSVAATQGNQLKVFI